MEFNLRDILPPSILGLKPTAHILWPKSTSNLIPIIHSKYDATRDQLEVEAVEHVELNKARYVTYCIE